MFIDYCMVTLIESATFLAPVPWQTSRSAKPINTDRPDDEGSCRCYMAQYLASELSA
jgi:hypothetical protein